LAASLGFWYLQIAPALVRRNYSVTMVDLRGHGLSSMPHSGYSQDLLAKDLEILLDTLGIHTVHLVAHSFGGCVALRFAFDKPERVRTMTLADVRVRAIQPRFDLGAWRAHLGNRAAVGFAALDFEDDCPDMEFAFFDRLANLALEHPDGLLSMHHVGASPFAGNAGRRAARRWMQLVQTTTARRELQLPEMSLQELSRLNKTTLLVYGEYSQALPSGLALAEMLPRGRLEILRRMGHFFPMTSPEKLVISLESFITSNELT